MSIVDLRNKYFTIFYSPGVNNANGNIITPEGLTLYTYEEDSPNWEDDQVLLLVEHFGNREVFSVINVNVLKRWWVHPTIGSPYINEVQFMPIEFEKDWPILKPYTILWERWEKLN